MLESVRETANQNDGFRRVFTQRRTLIRSRGISPHRQKCEQFSMRAMAADVTRSVACLNVSSFLSDTTIHPATTAKYNTDAVLGQTHSRGCTGCTLAPPRKYSGMSCAAMAMRAVAVITVATCCLILLRIDGCRLSDWMQILTAYVQVNIPRVLCRILQASAVAN